MKPAARLGPLVYPIPAEDLAELRLLHATTQFLREIPFAEVLETPYLIGPLRRTLQARRETMARVNATAARAAAEFELT